MRPYTFTQTDQNTVKSSCRLSGHTFFKRPPAASQPSTERTPADAYLPLSGQTIVDHLNNERLMCIQPCGRDVGSPSLALAIQRIAVEIPTPNRAAACRADMPAADAFNTRNRRSSLSARAIIHLLAVDVEPASPRRVTSQSIHQSQHLL
jgi:hypothetical protein